jgi:RNA polymerase sigma factor (sigma-70 family)
VPDINERDQRKGVSVPGSEVVAKATDSGLWQRGDEAAFGELFERHVQAVWNYCYRLTASRSLAEDVSAETFYIAWRRRKSMTLVGDNALPWLYTVAANLVRNEDRRITRFGRAVRRVRLEVVPDHAEQVTAQVAGEQRLREVLAAVARLPKAERRVVELCLLGDLSTSDAAEVLGIAESTVRAHVSRARARLREETS